MLLDGTQIAVDSFGHDALLFFCSHAHEDHLQGLHGAWSRGLVYCSETTARILSSRWPSLAGRLRPLPLSTHQMSLGETPLEVTLLDANHVPGAVMFVFSGHFGTLLHTGDFRLHPCHMALASLAPLRNGLTRIFLDNTFCHPDFAFPSREDAIKDALTRVSMKWPCLLFVAVYTLGKELLLGSLASYLCTSVFVPESRVQSLHEAGVAPELFVKQPCEPATMPESELRQLGLRGCVWAVKRKQMRQLHSRAASFGIATVGLSPTGWCADGECDGIETLQYSDHCSFLELVQFLCALPLAPVTLVSPVPTELRKFSYDGVYGMQQLLEFSGVPSITYSHEHVALAPRRAVRRLSPCRNPRRVAARYA